MRMTDAAAASLASGSFIVPPGASYSFGASGGTLAFWYELR
jgi:hypothetical protein